MSLTSSCLSYWRTTAASAAAQRRTRQVHGQGLTFSRNAGMKESHTRLDFQINQSRKYSLSRLTLFLLATIAPPKPCTSSSLAIPFTDTSGLLSKSTRPFLIQIPMGSSLTKTSTKVIGKSCASVMTRRSTKPPSTAGELQQR